MVLCVVWVFLVLFGVFVGFAYAVGFGRLGWLMFRVSGLPRV